MCHYCNKVGHLVSNCWAKWKDESEAQGQNRPQGLISSDNVTIDRKPNDKDVREEYRPFVSNGSVSPVGDPTEKKSVKILRDTGATQSLIVESSVPCGSDSATGESVIIQGVTGSFVSIPLHRIHLTSGLVSGPVEVGVVPSLPMKGISMLLGNELAGGRVIPHPKVVSEPVASVDTENIEEENPGIFPSCAVTRAQARKKAYEKIDERIQRTR